MKSRKERQPDHAQDDRKRKDAQNKSEAKQREKKLPGDYPSEEDIMNRMNTRRVGMDVENFSRTIGHENLNINEPVVTRPDSIEDNPGMAGDDLEDQREKASMERPVPRDAGDDTHDDDKTDADVTDEDLEALGPKDLSMDMGEDEAILKNRVWPVDMAGSDLDVPGADLDDKNEAIGSEDEENNSYSLGGDGHEDNMEGK